MCKVLVVDDEEIIGRGIKSVIERIQNPMLKDIRTAVDVEEAEEQIREWKPDIVITDICMPGESGLALIERGRSMDPRIRFIALSGYDTFDYVRKAFQLGAVDYLLKPATVDKLRDLLERVVQSILQEEEKKVTQQAYGKVVCQESLKRLMAGEHSNPLLNFDPASEVKSSLPFPYFCLGLVRLEKDANAYRVRQLIANTVQSRPGPLFREVRMELAEIEEKGNLVIVFNTHQKEQERDFYSFLETLSNSLQDLTGEKTFISMSECQRNLEALPQLYRQASDAMGYKVVLQNPVIAYNRINGRKEELEDTSYRLSELKEYMKMARFDKAGSCVDVMFDNKRLEGVAVGSIRRQYEKSHWVINSVLMEGGRASAEIAPREFETFRCVAEIRIYLKSTIYKAMEILKTQTVDRSVVDAAKKFIRENYNKDIDMAAVARKVSTGYAYFSTLFKEETGMNFSEYLTMIRMEEARKIQEDPTKKINHIAAEVGYNSPKYFTRVYKEYFGISPSSYRKKQECQ